MPTFRRALDADANAIWNVRTRAIRESCQSHYPPGDIDRWSACPMPADFERFIGAMDCVVADEHGDIAGWGFLNRQSGELDAIFVSPDRQRRGIGGQILAALEKIAVEAGLKSLRLSSTLNAVEFYRSAGFCVLRESRYEHPGGFSLACVLMEKSIGAGV